MPVLLFCIAVAIGTGILFGLWPAMQLSRPEVSRVMQASTRRTTSAASGRRLHNSLIAGQIAERPAFLEVYLDNNQLHYRPVSADGSEEKAAGLALTTV